MRVTISRNNLHNLLSTVSVAGGKNPSIPIISNVALYATEEGFLKAVGNNLEQEVSSSTQCEVAEAGALTVAYKRLKDIAQNLPEDASVTLSLTDDKLSVRSGRSRFTLATLPEAEFPRIETEEVTKQVTLNRADLLSCLKGTSFCASKADVRYYLNGILVEANENGLNFVGTDGIRLSHIVLDTSADFEARIILPNAAVNEIIKMATQSAAEVINLGIADRHIIVSDGHTTLASVLIDGKYPDYQRVIPKSNDNIVVLPKHDLLGLLKRSATLCDEKSRLVRLTLKENKLIAESSNSHDESCDDAIEISYAKEPFTIGLNLNHISEIISNTVAEEIQVKFGCANTAVVVNPMGKTNQTFLQMPMRL